MDHKYYGRLGRYTKLWAIWKVIPTKKLSMWSYVASFYHAKNGKLEQQNTNFKANCRRTNFLYCMFWKCPYIAQNTFKINIHINYFFKHGLSLRKILKKVSAIMEFSRKWRDLIFASIPFLKFIKPKKSKTQGKVIRPNMSKFYPQKNVTKPFYNLSTRKKIRPCPN